jgi:hypothetical protein
VTFSIPPEPQEAVVHDIGAGVICWCGHPNGAASPDSEALRAAAAALSESLVPYGTEGRYWTEPEPVFALRRVLRAALTQEAKP